MSNSWVEAAPRITEHRGWHYRFSGQGGGRHWTVCAFSLLAVIGVELWPAAPLPIDTVTPPPAINAAKPAEADLGPLTAAIEARPLFDPGRRPSLAALAAPVAVPAMAPAPRLSGTIVSARGERLAVLVPAGSDRSVTVREGDRAGDLRMIRIAAGEVVAAGPAGLLTLHVGFGAAATPPVPQPPQPRRERELLEQDE